MSRLNLVARRLSEALLVFTLALSPSFASADFSTRLQDLAAGKPIAGQALRSVVERWLPGTSLTEPPRFTTRAGEEVLARPKFDELAEWYGKFHGKVKATKRARKS